MHNTTHLVYSSFGIVIALFMYGKIIRGYWEMLSKTRISLLTIFTLITIMLIININVAYGESIDSKGSLVIIGGALSPDNEEVYNRFIELGGGSESIKIAIMPTASSSPTTSAESYKADFIYYGVPEENIRIFPIAVKDDRNTDDIDESTWAENGFSEEIAKEMEKYNAVFFVGGDQLRIVNCLVDIEGNDGPVLKTIRKIYENGGVIGGTSAGAAIMSDPMICGGTSLGALIQGVTYEDNYGIEGDNRVFITKGLGFLQDSIVDQHFLARGRLGRLITACFDQKINIGYGVDENTAVIVVGNEIEVVGENGVIIADISEALKDPDSVKMRATGIKLHYLEQGDKYNIESKEITINEAKVTTLGYEYYYGNSMYTDIFGPYSMVDAITIDLVDNEANECVGIAFDMENENKGIGCKLIFKKGQDTEGFWGKINGRETYAATNVYLDIVPIEIKMKSEKPYTPNTKVK